MTDPVKSENKPQIPINTTTNNNNNNSQMQRQTPTQQSQQQTSQQQQQALVAKQAQQKQAQQSHQQQGITQSDLNRLVLDYLTKKGFHQSEATLRIESTKIAGSPTVPLTTGNSSFSQPFAPSSNKSNIQYQQQQFHQHLLVSKQRQFDEDPKVFGRSYVMYRTLCENSLEMYN
ncbi:unnamed protein product [Ambrosiozyma monospora]|uniref:Unnamed protein product n=1 Tax=Ambrosiozyma monospora TaxID=43982 RepID=A0ACB5TZ49_AMBMO|nr:unnamed protein product [Ambrosiozyma monospora]